MAVTHHYELNVRWTGDAGTGTSDYRGYRRDNEILGAGKPVILGSSDPAFRGDAARTNPTSSFGIRAAPTGTYWPSIHAQPAASGSGGVAASWLVTSRSPAPDPAEVADHQDTRAGPGGPGRRASWPWPRTAAWSTTGSGPRGTGRRKPSRTGAPGRT